MDKQMAGRQLVNTAEHGFWRRHKLKSQVIVERLIVHLPLDPCILQNSLDFRGKNQIVAALRIVERLNTQAIAHQHEALLFRVVKGIGKHAPQALHRIEPIFLMGVDNNLAIRAADKMVSFLLQLLP